MVNCPLCKSSTKISVLRTKDNDPREIKSEKLFSMVRCSKCGLNYVDNMPSKNEMSKYYGEGYYAKKSIGNKIMKKFMMASRLSKIPKIRNGKILDYGCGNGDFLLEMREMAWIVNGVEFSEDARKITGKKLGIKILNEDEFYRLNKKFDVITLWHVLEHVENPDMLLKKLKMLLDKNGLLVMSVPNIQSFQFYIFGRNTFHLDIPRHLVHYSPRTIEKLLKKSGFGIKGLNYYSIEYNPFGFIQSFLNSIGCEFNFLYNVVKRGYKRRVSPLKFIYTALATFILLPFLVLLAILATYIESFFGYGASFVVYAKNE